MLDHAEHRAVDLWHSSRRRGSRVRSTRGARVVHEPAIVAELARHALLDVIAELPRLLLRLLLLLLRASVATLAPATVRIRSRGRLSFSRGFLLRATIALLVSFASAEVAMLQLRLNHVSRFLLYASMLSELRRGCRRVKLALLPQTSAP